MRNGGLLIVLGVLLLLGGIAALANPFAASLAVTTLVGIVLIISGATQLWLAFAHSGDPHRLWTAIVAIVALIAGISLIANPLSGVISLTILVGVLFLIMGVSRLVMAFRMRETPYFWLLLLSGAASAIIGILVFSNIMAAATTLLGLLLGIQLLADGIALISLGLFARKQT